jgi:hypothetical protein
LVLPSLALLVPFLGRCERTLFSRERNDLCVEPLVVEAHDVEGEPSVSESGK